MITILEGVGLLCMIFVVYYLVKKIFGFFYECISGPINLQKQGKWAVITGATDGIGKAFAEALAAKEINIILISRSMNKLQTVAEHLETKYNVETRVIEADFTKVTETYQHIKKHLFGYEIGILVNNVGLSYPYPEYFLDLRNSDIIYSGILNCNIYAMTNMCKIVMPGMVTQKKGVVINISSTAAKIPSPLLTVYGASKAFIEKFSTDLSTEYKQHGITVQCLMPGYVATKMSKIRKSTWMAPTPEDYVSHALKTTGIRDKCTGYYPHSMLVTVIHCIQYFSPQCATFIITQVMETLRKRALARQMS